MDISSVNCQESTLVVKVADDGVFRHREDFPKEGENMEARQVGSGA